MLGKGKRNLNALDEKLRLLRTEARTGYGKDELRRNLIKVQLEEERIAREQLQHPPSSSSAAAGSQFYADPPSLNAFWMQGSCGGPPDSASADSLRQVLQFTSGAKSSVYEPLVHLATDIEFNGSAVEGQRVVIERDERTGLPVSWVSGHTEDSLPHTTTTTVRESSSGATRKSSPLFQDNTLRTGKGGRSATSAASRTSSIADGGGGALSTLDRLVKIEKPVVLLFCPTCRAANTVDVAYHTQHPEQPCSCTHCHTELDWSKAKKGLTEGAEPSVGPSASAAPTAAVEVEVEEEGGGGIAVDSMGFEEEAGKGSFLEALMEFRASMKKTTDPSNDDKTKHVVSTEGGTHQEMGVGTSDERVQEGSHYLSTRMGVLKGLYFLHLKDSCF